LLERARRHHAPRAHNRSDTVQHSDKERRALQSILDRATTDPAFRDRLLNDPRDAIFETFGVMIPPNFRIKFIERGPGVDALVVLPDIVSRDAELSDDELEAVSGGVEDEGGDWAEDF
jgi:hypothetical protein